MKKRFIKPSATITKMETAKLLVGSENSDIIISNDDVTTPEGFD